MPRSAFSRSLIEAVRSSCWVRRNVSRSSSSRYSSSATRLTGPIASSFSSSSARRSRTAHEVARADRAAPAAPSPRRRTSGTPPAPAPRGARGPRSPCSSISWMRADEAVQLALRRARVSSSIARSSSTQRLVMLRRPARASSSPRSRSTATSRAADVGALALGGEPGAPLGRAAPGAAGPGRCASVKSASISSRRRSSRPSASARSVMPASSTRHGGQLAPPARSRPPGRRRSPRGRRPSPPRAASRPRVATSMCCPRRASSASRLGGLAGDLARLGADRLQVAVHALVLAHRLLEVLLAGQALGLPRLHRLLEAGQARAQRRDLGRRARPTVACSLVHRSGQPRDLVLELAQLPLARQQRLRAAPRPPSRRAAGRSATAPRRSASRTSPRRRCAATAPRPGRGARRRRPGRAGSAAGSASARSRGWRPSAGRPPVGAACRCRRRRRASRAAGTSPSRGRARAASATAARACSNRSTTTHCSRSPEHRLHRPLQPRLDLEEIGHGADDAGERRRRALGEHRPHAGAVALARHAPARGRPRGSSCARRGPARAWASRASASASRARAIGQRVAPAARARLTSEVELAHRPIARGLQRRRAAPVSTLGLRLRPRPARAASRSPRRPSWACRSRSSPAWRMRSTRSAATPHLLEAQRLQAVALGGQPGPVAASTSASSSCDGARRARRRAARPRPARPRAVSRSPTMALEPLAWRCAPPRRAARLPRRARGAARPSARAARAAARARPGSSGRTAGGRRAGARSPAALSRCRASRAASPA